MGWVAGWKDGTRFQTKEEWPLSQDGDPLRAWAVIQSLKDQGITNILWYESQHVQYASGVEARVLYERLHGDFPPHPENTLNGEKFQEG